MKDEHNVVTKLTLPGPLADLAGITIHDFDPQTSQEQEIDAPGTGTFPARVWFDILEPTTARTIATYTKGYYSGKAALTANRFGNGTVYYLGTEAGSPEFYSKGVKALADRIGIPQGPNLPEGVEYAVREKPGRKIVFLLNYTDKSQTVTLDQTYRNALTGEAEPVEVQIPSFDVKVLTNP